MISVAEACRNVSAMGAEPVALTNCLNFGNPERSDVYYQLEKCVQGLARASEIFDAPIISGNVSLYNETRGTAIYPTPIIGALGILDDVTTYVTPGFKEVGDLIVLIGSEKLHGNIESIGGSEYLEAIHGLVAGQPTLQINLEISTQRACIEASKRRLLSSAHDCSDGGLAVAISESCIAGNMGANIYGTVSGRWDALLFGEDQSRILVSINPINLPRLEEICRESGAMWMLIGTTGGTSMIVPGLIEIPVDDLYSAWTKGINKVSDPSGSVPLA